MYIFRYNDLYKVTAVFQTEGYENCNTVLNVGKGEEKSMRQAKKIYCNMCGKEFHLDNEIVKEGILSVEKCWGYFSEKDGEIHELDLCEACYDKLIKQFKIPVTVKKQKEFV